MTTEANPLLVGFDASARTALAPTWLASWSALLEGRRRYDRIGSLVRGWPDDSPTCCLQDWPGGLGLADRGAALAFQLGRDARPFHDELVASNPGLRLSVVVATSHGEADAVSAFTAHRLDAKLPVRPTSARGILCDPLLGKFLDGLGSLWPGCTMSTACASAGVATGFSMRRVSSGMCDAVLIVSLDVLSRVAHAGFRQIGAMSVAGCRPFDRRRDGTTIGEAGAVMLVTRKGVALPRASRWVVELLGFGQSCDARHPVETSPQGVCDALNEALDEAALLPTDLAAVYWHGTGTIQNDRTEAQAATKLFAGSPPPGTSTKGAFGHAMGASAALSLLAAGETVTYRRLPPVAGLEHPDFPDLNLTMTESREVAGGPIAVMSLGFGGINAAIVLGPRREEAAAFATS